MTKEHRARTIRAPPPPADTSGTFASGTPVKIPPGRTLIAYPNLGYTATLTATYLTGKTAPYPPFPAVYAKQIFSSEVFVSVAPSAKDPNIVWLLIPEGEDSFDSNTRLLGLTDTPTVLGSDGTAVAQDPSGNLKQAGHQTLVAAGNYQASAGASGGFTQTLFTTSLPVGSRLWFTLAINGAPSVNGDVYIYIEGGTSGSMYAICGCNMSVASFVDITTVEAGLVLVAVNGDNTGHYCVCAVQVTQP